METERWTQRLPEQGRLREESAVRPSEPGGEAHRDQCQATEAAGGRGGRRARRSLESAQRQRFL